MDLKDNKGRWIEVTSPEINTGHSVCNNCGKDMPGCWDIICKKCNRTFCYDCVIHSYPTHPKYWYCKECYKPTLIERIINKILKIWREIK